MIRYSTSNDRKCKAVRNWCREHGYAYSFDEKDRSSETYPFVILAPSYAEEDMRNAIRKAERR